MFLTEQRRTTLSRCQARSLGTVCTNLFGKVMTMTYKTTETTHLDDIEFAAGYGTAVAMTRPAKASVGGNEWAVAGQPHTEGPISDK
jgi:hypothetical protein